MAIEFNKATFYSKNKYKVDKLKLNQIYLLQIIANFDHILKEQKEIQMLLRSQKQSLIQI